MERRLALSFKPTIDNKLSITETKTVMLVEFKVFFWPK